MDFAKLINGLETSESFNSDVKTLFGGFAQGIADTQQQAAKNAQEIDVIKEALNDINTMGSTVGNINFPSHTLTTQYKASLVMPKDYELKEVEGVTKMYKGEVSKPIEFNSFRAKSKGDNGNYYIVLSVLDKGVNGEKFSLNALSTKVAIFEGDTIYETLKNGFSTELVNKNNFSINVPLHGSVYKKFSLGFMYKTAFNGKESTINDTTVFLDEQQNKVENYLNEISKIRYKELERNKEKIVENSVNPLGFVGQKFPLVDELTKENVTIE